MTPHSRRRRRRLDRRVLAGRIALGVIVGLMVVLIAGGAWVGVRAVQALPHIERAQQLATSLDAGAVIGGDTTQIDELQDELAAARSLTSGVVWSAGERLPWVGPQLSAVSTVTAALDEIAASAISTVATAGAEGAEALLPDDDRIDLDALSHVRDSLVEAQSTITAGRTQVDSIETSALVRPLRDGVTQVSTLLADLEPALDGLARATTVLPTFLGGEGPREHLLLLQNNAEWRSLGGIVGSTILIGADDGHIELQDQVSAASFDRRDESIIPLSFEAGVVYGDRPGRYMQNPTMVPEFPEAAALARAMWVDRFDTDPTGVISIDPVALSYMLEATGPIELPTGDTLTSDNAVDLLLNDVYLRYEDPAAQDAFFGVAAASVFDALIDGDGDPAAMLQAITRAIDEHRLLVWSADQDEQQAIEGTPVEGALPVTDEATTSFGVYLNDGVGAKLDYYVAAGAAAQWCSPGTARLRVELRNDAPGDIRTYPDYLLGTSGDTTASGAPRGIARTLVYLYLPGDIVDDAATDGDMRAVGTHGGYTVYEWFVDLEPGDAVAADVVVDVTEAGAELEVRQTPVISAIDVDAGC